MIEITEDERQLMIDRLKTSLDENPIIKEFIMKQ